MKRCKTILSVLLAVIMLAGMLSFGALSASAAVTPPGHPFWDGFVARWEAPDDEVVLYYRLYLYKDGTEIRMEYPETNDYDFESVIKSYGTGNYQFSVAAAIGNDQEDTSEFVYSSTFYYNSSSEHTLIRCPFKYPGCTTAGDKGHYECTTCDKWFWDENAQYEITDRDEVLTEPIGHDWGEWVTTKEATQTEDGEAQRVCRNDPSHIETKVIPRLDGGAGSATEAKATEAPSTEASEATQPTGATQPGTELSTSSDATINQQDANFLLSLFSGSALTVLIIILAAVLIIAAAIIIIVVVVKKKKKQEQAQQYGAPYNNYGQPYDPTMTPPTDEGKPDPNDYHDPYNG